jgi:hypothetical protein
LETRTLGTSSSGSDLEASIPMKVEREAMPSLRREIIGRIINNRRERERQSRRGDGPELLAGLVDLPEVCHLGLDDRVRDEGDGHGKERARDGGVEGEGRE